MRVLFDRGGDVHAKESRRSTALNLAALNGHAEAVGALLEYGVHTHEDGEDDISTALY